VNYLVDDDDAAFCATLARVLTRRGHKVVTATNGVDAVQHCQLSTIDRAILDLKLDRESGLVILQQLRLLQPNIQIVILTGYSSIATVVEAIKLGAINYLIKPASTDDIVSAFEQVKGNIEAQVQEVPSSANRLEWEHIQRVLKENNGNISGTARNLGMHRRTLQRKLLKRPVKQ